MITLLYQHHRPYSIMPLQRFLLDLIFPPRCFGCEAASPEGVALCKACERAIVLHQTLFCGGCGLRLPYGTKVCHVNFPYILGAAADFGNDAVRNLVHALKFKYVKGAADALGELLVRYAVPLELPLTNRLVIPIPLSSARLRERGFNQSELIARVFARHFGLPLVCAALTRVKHTKPQSETKGTRERRENIMGAFAVRRPELVADKNIFLIDDVTTSGSTLLEAAMALKNAGARNIIALAVARA